MKLLPLFILLFIASVSASTASAFDMDESFGGGLGDWKTIEGKWAPAEERGSTVARPSGTRGTLLYGTSLPQDYALEIRFHIKGPEQVVKWFLRLESETLKRGYYLELDTRHRRLSLHDAGAPAVPIAHAGDNLRTSSLVGWKRLKVQLRGGRISAKLWRDRSQEPLDWTIDVFDKTHRGDRFAIQVSNGAEADPPPLIDSLKSIPFEIQDALGDPATLADHLESRFGAPRDIPAPRFEFKDLEYGLEIKGERTRLVFSRRIAAISELSIRRKSFRLSSIPDIRVVDENGESYRQVWARESTLDPVPIADEDFFELQGSVTPSTTSRKPGPYKFDIRYRIHRATGLIQVFSSVASVAEGAPRVRYLAFQNSIGDRPADRLNSVRYTLVDETGLIKSPPGLRSRKPREGREVWPVLDWPSRRSSTILGEKLSYAEWSSYLLGMQVVSLGYASSFIDPALAKNPETAKYLTVGTRSGSRFLDLVPINVKPGNDVVLRVGDHYRYGISFLPWRKYRPDVELVSSSWIGQSRGGPGGPAANASVQWQERAARTLVRMGATVLDLGPYTGGNSGEEQSRKRGLKWWQTRGQVFRHLGLKPMLGLGTSVQSGELDDYREWGWVRDHDDFESLARKDFRRFAPDVGLWAPGWPNGPSHTKACLNSPLWRRILLQNTMLEAFETIPSLSIAYLDDAEAVGPCDNELHDCVQQTTPVWGNLEFIDDWKQSAARKAGKKLILNTDLSLTNSQGAADLCVAGDFSIPPYLPRPEELDTFFTSLRHGVQCVFHTGNGGLKYDIEAIYHLALSRCATVSVSFLDHEQLRGGNFTSQQRAEWTRFMTPLTIYDVNSSEVHHPFDFDYGNYVTQVTSFSSSAPTPWRGRSEKPTVYPIVYRRAGDVLLVIAKDLPSVDEASVSLNADALGLHGSAILIVDAVSQKFSLFPIDQAKKQIVLKNLDLKYPQMLRLVNRTGESGVVWHNQIVWRVVEESSSERFEARLTGIPGETGRVHVHCPVRTPARALGAEIESFDTTSRVATLRLTFDAEARARFVIEYE